MWCPEGYYSWNNALSDLGNCTENLLALVSQGGKPKTLVNGTPKLMFTAEHYLIAAGLAENYAEAGLTIGIVETWLMVNYLEFFPPTLASLDGKRITVGDVFFSHRDQLEGCMFSWPIKEASEFLEFYKLQKLNGFSRWSLLDRFNFIDATTGLVRAKNGTAFYLENGIGIPIESLATVMDIAASLKNFSVCWESAPDKTEMREFLNCLEVDDTFTIALDYMLGEMPAEPKQDPLRKSGRPTVRPIAAAEFLEAYPRGLKEVTISEAARKLGYDRKTLRAAIKEIDLGEEKTEE